MTTLTRLKCSVCGRETDWDETLGPNVLCDKCWDAGEEGKLPARSSVLAAKGIYTGEDFARLMAALMADILEGRVSPDIAKATCLAAQNLLKIVEMQYKLTAGRTMELKESGAQLQIMAPEA